MHAIHSNTQFDCYHDFELVLAFFVQDYTTTAPNFHYTPKPYYSFVNWFSYLEKLMIGEPYWLST